MTPAELIQQILGGNLLLVAEFRGARVEKAGYLDRKSGQVAQYFRAIYIVERSCCGSIDRVIITQKLPAKVESPNDVRFPYEKGQHLVFALEGFKKQNGQLLGWIGDRWPESLESVNVLNLVSFATTPQSV